MVAAGAQQGNLCAGKNKNIAKTKKCPGWARNSKKFASGN